MPGPKEIAAAGGDPAEAARQAAVAGPGGGAPQPTGNILQRLRQPVDPAAEAARQAARDEQARLDAEEAARLAAQPVAPAAGAGGGAPPRLPPQAVPRTPNRGSVLSSAAAFVGEVVRNIPRGTVPLPARTVDFDPAGGVTPRNGWLARQREKRWFAAAEVAAKVAVGVGATELLRRAGVTSEAQQVIRASLGAIGAGVLGNTFALGAERFLERRGMTRAASQVERVAYGIAKVAQEASVIAALGGVGAGIHNIVGHQFGPELSQLFHHEPQQPEAPPVVPPVVAPVFPPSDIDPGADIPVHPIVIAPIEPIVQEPITSTIEPGQPGFSGGYYAGIEVPHIVETPVGPITAWVEMPPLQVDIPEDTMQKTHPGSTIPLPGGYIIEGQIINDADPNVSGSDDNPATINFNDGRGDLHLIPVENAHAHQGEILAAVGIAPEYVHERDHGFAKVAQEAWTMHSENAFKGVEYNWEAANPNHPDHDVWCRAVVFHSMFNGTESMQGFYPPEVILYAEYHTGMIDINNADLGPEFAAKIDQMAKDLQEKYGITLPVELVRAKG